MWWTLPLVVLALAVGWFLRLARGSGSARAVVAAAMLCSVAPFAAVGEARPTALPAPVRVTATGEYVSSSACKSCHPSEYASWHDTYHRTMTQSASRAAVAAPLVAPATLQLDGDTYVLARQGEKVLATWPHEPPARVILTTGSHHYQAYWVARAGKDPTVFPFVYLLGAERRFVPRREAFVQPPGRDAAVRWSSNCIQCHTTAGSPGYDPERDLLDPEVAELGVACEACHGPGAAHVRKHQDPFERYAARAGHSADATIVNPARLPPDRASMICGACHAYTYPRDEDEFWSHGYARSYRAGQDLGLAKVVLTRDLLGRPGAPTIDAAPDDLFYGDGTVRIGGREYNGLVLSACFLHGEGTKKLGCLSCHSMHASAPDDQLARGKEGDGACASCHEASRFASIAHTHHPAGTPGSSCLDCHMPMTSYALLKSIRSHRIDSPNAASVVTADRPNACNLCHLDKTLEWTRSALLAWYPGALSSTQTTVTQEDAPVGAVWLLAGDPGQRAIAAAAMATPGARAAVKSPWLARMLRAATDDPYAAVRFIARRSLRVTGAFGDDATQGALVEALVARRSGRALTLSE